MYFPNTGPVGAGSGLCGVQAAFWKVWRGRGHFHWTLMDGVGVGMVFLVVGPGGQRHGGREGPDVSWEIQAVKGLERFWLAALELLP